MCRFVETIRLQNHRLYNMYCHQMRYERTVRHFFGGEYNVENLEEIAAGFADSEGVNKVRIVYDGAGIVSASCAPYRMKHTRSLRLVECDGIDYTYKYADRTALDNAMNRRGGCDNVVIVRDGLITDTSYTNIALYDGIRWLTPAHPLLQGTALTRLLDEGRLIARDIKAETVWGYSHIALFNSMIDFGKLVLPTACVVR